MEFLKCQDVRWKGPKKQNKPGVVATRAKHPDEGSQISHYGWMQPTYMRSVSFWGKFISGSRISAGRGGLLKVPSVCSEAPGGSGWGFRVVVDRFSTLALSIL